MRLSMRQERICDVLIELGGSALTAEVEAAVRYTPRNTLDVLLLMERKGLVAKDHILDKYGRKNRWTLTHLGRMSAVEYNPNVWLSEPWDEAS